MTKLPAKREYIMAYKKSKNLNKSFAIGNSDEWYGLRVSKTIIKQRNKLFEDLKKLNTDAEKKMKNKLNWNPRYEYIDNFISIDYAETPEDTVKAIRELLETSKNNLKNDMEWLKKKASLKN